MERHRKRRREHLVVVRLLSFRVRQQAYNSKSSTSNLKQPARKMKAKEFSADDIAELTGLTAGEIKAL